MAIRRTKINDTTRAILSRRQLHHLPCDCAEILPLLGKVDAIVTDPPYGIGKGNILIGRDIKKGKYDDFDWDTEAPSKELFNKLLEQSTYQIIFGGNYFELPIMRGWLVWYKKQAARFSECELIWTNLDITAKTFTYHWAGAVQETTGASKENRVHPTQKPIKVMEWCLEHLPIKTGLIVDPFMGSGTTLIAARNAGFKAIGIDQDERYCKFAKERLTGELGLTVGQQKALDLKAAGQMNLLDLIGGS